MRRKLSSILLIAIILGTSGVIVHASDDCAKWLAMHKADIARSAAAKRIRHTGRRIHHYAKRKLAQYTTPPKPAVQPQVHRTHLRRRLTPQQTLRRFDMACLDLPDSPDNGEYLSSVPTDPFPPIFSWEGGSAGHLIPPVDDVGGPIASIVTDTLDTPPNGGLSYFPIEPGAGPFMPTPIGGFSLPPSPFPSGPPYHASIPPPTPSPVPEPGTLILLTTGLAGAAGLVRRRLRS